MEAFIFHIPTEFVFGKETEKRAGEMVAKYGGRMVLIVYGGGHAVKSGLLERVERSLAESGISFVSLGGIEPNPMDLKVYEGIELARSNQVDFLLAVGGGSVIDTAKAIAAGASYAGDFWDFYSGKVPVEEALPVGVVLTIPASGSEASGNSVITRTAGLHKISLRTGEVLRPKFSIMNPELTMTLSPWQMACGVADMMSHVMERYFSNTTGVEITDRLCEGALKAIIVLARRAMKDPQDYDVRANLMWCGTVAHGGSCGVGREEDWASHFMEHEVSAVYNVTHGAGLAVIQPAWLTWLAGHRPEKVAQFAARVWDVPETADCRLMALKGVRCLREFLKSIGLPSTFAELGVAHPDIDLLVAKLLEDKGESFGNYVKLDGRAAREIFELAC